MEPQQNPTPMTAEKKSFGPIVGIVVILVVIVLGGLYFWGGMMSKSNEATTEKLPSDQTAIDHPDTATPATNTTDFADIEAGLNTNASDTSVDFSELDSSLGQ